MRKINLSLWYRVSHGDISDIASEWIMVHNIKDSDKLGEEVTDIFEVMLVIFYVTADTWLFIVNIYL